MTTTDRASLEDEFVRRLRARWQRGAAEYGDRSFDLPLAATAEELLAEAEDLAGWGFVVWVQLRQRLARIEAAAERLAPVLDAGSARTTDST